MSVTRILGIAPYESMRSLMMQLAANMENVALTAFVGDLRPGAEIAKRYTDQDFDVILSRGGTAELIRAETTLPVVDIELSMYDILRAIRLAESSNSRYAIVGFPAITRNTYILCDMLQLDVALYTIHNEEEARQVLQQLSQQGCPMVLCDMVTNSLAHEYGLPALLITSGSESVEAALHQAVSINQIVLPQRDHAHMLEAALTATATLSIRDENDREVFSSLPEDLPAPVCSRLALCHQAAQANGAKRSTVTAKDRQYQLSGQQVAIGERRYTAVLLRHSSTWSCLEKEGIRFLGKEEIMDRFYNNFYGVTQHTDALLIERCAASGAALMLMSEPGIDAEQIARLIYSKSPQQHAPLCTIDCALLQKKGWNYLMTNTASPLTDSGATVYFTHMDELEEDWFMQLFRMIRDTRFKQRNRLIFSCILQPDTGLSPRVRLLMDWFSCMAVELPPLRSHREDLPHLASLYISLLNMRDTREIVGVEPEAMRLLEAYHWPANHDQFKRVLQELAMLTDTPHITLANVQRVLHREERMYPSRTAAPTADILRGKTLEEIDLLALKLALAECNGNQRAAAEKLGISRTTLWRMLQRENTKNAGQT